jgi:hypothetical protein
LGAIVGPTNENGEWRIKCNNEIYTLYKESDIIIIMVIFIKLRLGFHPVAVVFNTYTGTCSRFVTKFTSGGLHEKHVVATCNLENHLSICLKDTGKPRKPVSR